MRFMRGEVRDHIVSSKIDHGLRSGVEKQRSRERSAFARFLGLFDFRLLQQCRHVTDMQKYPGNVRYWVPVNRGRAADARSRTPQV